MRRREKRKRWRRKKRKSEDSRKRGENGEGWKERRVAYKEEGRRKRRGGCYPPSTIYLYG